MGNFLDHIPAVLVLSGIEDYPKTCTKKVWFQITRELLARTIDDMDLDPVPIAEVDQAFIGAGLL